MDVNDVVRARIAAAGRKRQRRARQRARLAEARERGLQARHAAKLRHLAGSADRSNPIPCADAPACTDSEAPDAR